jgi:hypothetical protein
MPKAISSRRKMQKVANELMRSDDAADKYKGAMLQLKINEKNPPKTTTVVDPFVMSFYEMVQRLSDELGLPGDVIIARLGEQTEALEQLVR